LRKDTLVLICHPHHPLAKSSRSNYPNWPARNSSAFEPDIPTRKAIDKILKDHNVEVETVMEFDNIETVKRAVEIEAGISIVPQGTITQEVAKQTLAEVKIEGARTLSGRWRRFTKRTKSSRPP
jgi:DNA-binding transcriptional LysR family regulator